MNGKQAIIEENKLALACKKKALKAEHGTRLYIVDNDEYTANALNSGVFPVLCASSMATGIPQRSLRNVVITANGEYERDTGVIDTSYGYTSAVKHMNKYLGKDAEVLEEPQEAPVKQVVKTKQPVVDSAKTSGSVLSLVEELLG